ncbi:MAG: serine/threonine protein kinase [Xanthomonadales bacterium]|nr:serine/threonine protein kinase [Xanthomonadales bacterium]
MQAELSDAAWTRLRSTFEHALDLPTVEREDWLARQLADAPTLQQAARRMLAALDAPASSLDRLAGAIRTPIPEAGEQVGSQRLLRRIGSGGTGEVWEAARRIGADEQRVAVKLLACGAGPALAQPIEAERRILARLNHPNICTLLDAGIDSQGRPYLVLEHVRGEPLTDWCYARRTPLDARLRLFLETCDGVAHAHSQLIIHRDLKPAHVLVGASGRIKLLDFGIARLLGERSNGSGLTGMLTPAYASPEQVRGDPVGTHCDIYSLGVILYELICDQPPYALQACTPRQLMERLQHPDHPTPSQILRARGQRRLAGRVAAGLDAVVARAMHPLATQRYATVDALADDLRRWLLRKPVRARRPDWPYRLSCFVRRHLLACSLAVATSLLLSSFTAVLWQRLEAERTALAVAEEERQLSQHIGDFLVGLFAAADPDRIEPDRVDLQTLLDRGRADLGNGAISDPQLRAGLSTRMAQVYVSLGLYEPAQALLEPLETALPGLPAWHQAQWLEAQASVDLARSDAATAEQHLRQALALREAPAQRARIHYQLAVALRDQAHYDAAAAQLQQAAAWQRNNDPQALLRTQIQQGSIAWLNGDLHGAQLRYRRALADGEAALPPNHPDLARALNGLSLVAHRLGDYAEAIPSGERALRIQRQVFGPTHPAVAQTLANLGALLADAGQLEAARLRLLDALRIQQPRQDELGAALTNTYNNLGLIALRDDQAEAASAWLELGLAAAMKAHGPMHPQVASLSDNLGLCLQKLGRVTAAEQHFARALEIRRQTLEPMHPHLAYSYHHLGRLALQQDQLSLAQTHLQRALSIRQATLADKHPLTATSLLALADLHRAQGHLAQARDGYRQAMAIWERAQGDHGTEMASARAALAGLPSGATQPPDRLTARR